MKRFIVLSSILFGFISSARAEVRPVFTISESHFSVLAPAEIFFEVSFERSKELEYKDVYFYLDPSESGFYFDHKPVAHPGSDSLGIGIIVGDITAEEGVHELDLIGDFDGVLSEPIPLTIEVKKNHPEDTSPDDWDDIWRNALADSLTESVTSGCDLIPER